MLVNKHNINESEIVGEKIFTKLLEYSSSKRSLIGKNYAYKGMDKSRQIISC